MDRFVVARRILFSFVAGGITTTLLLWGNFFGFLFSSPAIGQFCYLAVFWSVGVFSDFFDWITGTQSVWFPHPLAFLASFALSSLLYAVVFYFALSAWGRIREPA